ncbi:MAG: epimerase [Woeseiaceae bacterium]|nr:epimerase [Woeseiaceae bacterium]
MNSRRDILKAGLVGSAVAASGLPISALAGEQSQKNKSLNLLILGGTGFIGPHMVREALRRGHAVTLFNRGRTNNDLFPDLETITGDRAGDLEGLKGRSWDAVVDNSGYMPQQVRASARLLANSIGHYIFISSISAYASFANANDEDSPLASLDAVPEEFSWENYGALKAISEKWAADEIGEDRYTVLRPTYICGPGDHTDRFTYWPVRASKGGEMLWPGSPEQPLQIIDVRDLANFVVDCVEKRIAGTYNTVTPVGSYTFGQFLEESNAVNNSAASPVWVSNQFIADNDIGSLLPVYHPLTGDNANVSSVSGERARAAGLRNRPVRETIRDLMSWWRTLPAERIDSARFAMTPEREAELVALWKASQS